MNFRYNFTKDDGIKITALITLYFLLMSIFPANFYAHEITATNKSVINKNDNKTNLNSDIINFNFADSSNFVERIKNKNQEYKQNNIINYPVVKSNIAKPEQYTIIEFNNVILEIPPFAVKEPTEITIEKLDVIQKLNNGMENATGEVNGYRFLPDGMKFESEIKIIMPYDKNKTDDEDLMNLYTYFYNEESLKWEKLERIGLDTDKGNVISLTTHFTDMINSILKLPDSAKPLSFNPNSIKDIKAANPHTNISQLDGLTPNSNGSANFSIPLTLPPGRKGIMPSLALSYSSNSGNGWCGVGFDIPISQINIDTKFGVPDYSGNETYLLNGSELVKTDTESGVTIYRERIEGNFYRIKRYGSNAQSYYFIVTDKSGTQYIYGTADAVNRSDRNNAIYKWFLKKVLDVNGNNVNYYYSIDNKYTYISSITYTGYNNDDGLYKISFENESRDDKQIDCRGKFLSHLNYRLKNIKISFQNKVIRKYTFDYEYNDMLKSSIKSFSEYVHNSTDNDNDASLFFYAYKFKYKSIKNSDGELVGYKEVKEITNFNNPSVNVDHSFGGGGSVYAGVGFMNMTYSAGGEGGFNLDYGFNQNTLLDINGDGLPDFIEKKGNTSGLKVKLNNGNYGFLSNDQLSGESTLIDSLMSETFQSGFNIGTSGGMGQFISGSFNGKFDWSLGLSTFADINGDGFIDYIPSKNYLPVKDYYLKGTATNNKFSFSKFYWGDNNYTPSISGLSNPDEDKVKQSLYLTDPVIKWKSYKKGTIQLLSTVKKVDSGNHEEYDGVKIDIFKNNETLIENEEDSIIKIKDRLYTANKELTIDTTSDNLYFKVNSRDDIKNDKINWNIEIMYKNIYLHDNMRQFYDNTYDLTISYDKASFENKILPKIANSYDKSYIQSVYPPVYEIIKNAQGDIISKTIKEYKLITPINEYNKCKIRKIIIDNKIRNRKYYLYNDNMYEVKLNNSLYYIELPDRETRDLNTKEIKDNAIDNKLGITTANGIIIDYITDGTNIKKRYLKDDGNTVKILDEENNKIKEVTTGITFNRDSYLLNVSVNNNGIEKKYYLKDLTNDSDRFNKISKSFFIDLSNDINFNPDNTYDLTKCYDEKVNYFELKSNYNTIILPVIEAKIKEKGISNYDLLDRKDIISENAVYETEKKENITTPITEETINNDPLESGKAVTKTSIINLEDFTATGDIQFYQKYIHIFDRESDFDLSNISKDSNSKSLLIESIPADLFENILKYLRDKTAKEIELETREGKSIKTNKEILLMLYTKSLDGKTYNLNSSQKAVNLPGSSMTYGQKGEIILFSLGFAEEYFTGGLFNWNYGEWNGNIKWDINKIGITDENNCYSYLIGMSPIKQNETMVLEGASESANKIGVDIWKGSDFEYSDRKGDAEGNIKEIVEYTACYISKNEINPTRKGGESIKYIPSSSGHSDKGLSDYLRKSFNRSFNAGLSSMGFNFNYTLGQSIGYHDFFDLNGDRYPDEVNEEPNTKFLSVIYNSAGQNFGSSDSFTNVFRDFRSTTTNSISTGGSVSTQVNNETVKFSVNPSGDVQSVCTTKPKASMGGGITGTFSGNMTTIDWIDINGDGLIDQVCRDPIGDKDASENYFRVKLNVGDGFEDYNFDTSNWSRSDTILSKTNAIRNSILFGGNFQLSSGGSMNTSVSVSAGINANVGCSGNAVQVDMIDINGDGLPDQVMKLNETPFIVKLNLGSSFSNEMTWETVNNWMGLDKIDFLNKSIDSLKSSVTSYMNKGRSSLQGVECNTGNLQNEVNGILNSGQNNPSGQSLQLTKLLDTISYNGTINAGVGIDIGIGIPLPPGFISIYVSPSGNFAYSCSNAVMNLQMIDINGDGLLDHVLTADNKMVAKINNSGMSGLLTEIETPQGGVINIDYSRTENSIESPHCHYVMSSVLFSDNMTTDKIDEKHNYGQKFYYNNPKYDRAERAFYGFEGIKIESPDGSYSYNNYYITPSVEDLNTNAKDYYTKGLLLESKIYDCSNHLWQKEENSYTLEAVETKTEKAVISPKIKQTTKTVYDLNGNTLVLSTRMNRYDEYGNIISATQEGDVLKQNDDVLIDVKYAYENNTTLLSKYIVSLPETVDIKDYGNSLMRQRKAVYDNYGNLIEHKTYYKEQNRYISVNYNYDAYGNVLSVTDPKGYKINYSYDSLLHSYMKNISDIEGYTTTIDYDCRLGVDIESTDIAGSKIKKEYDLFGRLEKVFTDYDGTIPAVQFTYFNNEFPARAVSYNKIHYDSNNSDTLETVIITDGLGRVIQTKKEGVKTNLTSSGTKESSLTGMNISGSVEYDRMGRVVKQGFPAFREGYNLNYDNTVIMENPTITEYDSISRIKKNILPDGSYIENTYEITPEGLYKTTVRDPNGKYDIKYTDISENVVKTEQYNKGQTVTADFKYDLFNQKIEIKDNSGNLTSIIYDSLGRQTALKNPDAGLFEFFYDDCNNIVAKLDNNGRNGLGSIRYEYQYSRLTKIDYPGQKQDVVYTYGTAGSTDNSAGRLTELSDESGITTFNYGKLGEKIKETKLLNRLTAMEEPINYISEFGYDYLGRIEWLKYPDGEIVKYTYNAGGEIESVDGIYAGTTFSYVKFIGYDEYSRKNYIKYGNNVETAYTYDKDRAWLSNIKTQFNNIYYQNIDYTFDKTGNILSKHNKGTYFDIKETFKYDDLYQLTEASGLYLNDRSSLKRSNEYKQTYSYDSIGNMARKTSYNYVKPELVKPGHLNYDFTYTYNKDKPHQLTQAGDIKFQYDANGNLIKRYKGDDNTTSQIQPNVMEHGDGYTILDVAIGWEGREKESNQDTIATYTYDCRNKLIQATTSGKTSYYMYDSAGERTAKKSEIGETIYVSQYYQQNIRTNLNNFTKHIYLGNQRIVSKLGNNLGSNDIPYQRENIYTYHTDHISSSNAVTDAKGEIFEFRLETAYGESWVEESQDTLDKISVGFTGQLYDKELNMYYFHARYYDPQLSMFINIDPILSDIDGNLGLYCYAKNNPIRFNDPSGLITNDTKMGQAGEQWTMTKLKELGYSVIDDDKHTNTTGPDIIAYKNKELFIIDNKESAKQGKIIYSVKGFQNQGTYAKWLKKVEDSIRKSKLPDNIKTSMLTAFNKGKINLWVTTAGSNVAGIGKGLQKIGVKFVNMKNLCIAANTIFFFKSVGTVERVYQEYEDILEGKLPVTPDMGHSIKYIYGSDQHLNKTWFSAFMMAGLLNYSSGYEVVNDLINCYDPGQIY